MYAFLRTLNTRTRLLVEAPAFLASMTIAEMFYRFHSFTLECLAFLATWVTVSALAMAVSGSLPRKARTSTI